MNYPNYILEAVIVSFWETITTPDGKDDMQFKKRYYPSEDKAKEFIARLVNSGRRITALQLKTNYKVEVK